MTTAPDLPLTAARAGAEWWATCISNPTFQQVRPTERTFESELFRLMRTADAANHPVAGHEIAAFTDALEQLVAARLQRYVCVRFGVDYGPDTLLAQAASAAGVDWSRFSIKTRMAVHHDHVTASLGYGAPHALVWTAPDWVRPRCGTQRYDETVAGRFDALDEVCGLLRYHDGDHGGWLPDPKRCQACGGTYAAHYGNAGGASCEMWERSS